MFNYLNPTSNLIAFQEISNIIKQNWNLTIEMTRRDLIDQYSGQMFGKIWVILHPLCFMGLYVFIFSVVFRTRIGGSFELPLDYTSYMLSGLIPWLCLQQAMSKSCIALIGQANLVKQVVFPIEVLPIKIVLATLSTLCVSLFVLFCYQIFQYRCISLTWFLLPMIISIQLLAMAGIGFFFSSISVFIRDLKDIIAVLVSIGIYLMPVVYLPNWVPEMFQPLLYLNFFSYMIWCYQDVLYFGRIEHPEAWLVFSLGSILLYILGYRFFRKLKPYFGNYL